jgi:hypothetical protein
MPRSQPPYRAGQLAHVLVAEQPPNEEQVELAL